jgi:SAM-dependent methyltransferase
MPPPRITRPLLTRQQARAHYDTSGRWQDSLSFYGRPAIARLLEHGEFTKAAAVVEFGCGAGGLAQRLLEEHLPIYAKYSAFDLSETMVQRTRKRLISYGARVSVTMTDCRPRVPLPPGSCDRFISTYVLDLLPGPDIAKLLSQAWMVLRPGGLLCLASITSGTTSFSRLVMGAWKKLHTRNPALVGGCRPISIAPYLGPASWKILYSTIVVARGVASEVLVARPRAHARDNQRGNRSELEGQSHEDR